MLEEYKAENDNLKALNMPSQDTKEEQANNQPQEVQNEVEETDMEIIKTVKDRSPILLGLVIALMVSVVLIIAGFKVKSQSLTTSVLLWIIGVVGILICLYLILFSIFFGMNW